ncbi:hypothetical protein CLOM_g2250 [Closterium sp. NIES-68]|nr:hypothetical protein CLOM_g2250 [Closterium sp. NIES-68]GJP58045.1 hypothetical protein CLOP_g20153 [Closterium sp. NIES-67]GJP81507.1 hypothetical protein CLOP_g11651 [Closterium sp. NIES-67]
MAATELMTDSRLHFSSRQSRAVLATCRKEQVPSFRLVHGSTDLDLLALEGCLSLLDAQRELNAIRCEQFVTRLQSFLREGESDGDELRHDWESGSGRRMASRYSHSREAAAAGAGEIPRAQSAPEIGGHRAPRSTRRSSSHAGRSARSQGLASNVRLTRWASCEQRPREGGDGW